LWFTESNVDQIGEFTTATSTFREFRIPTSGASPFELTSSNTGIWFAEQGTGKIGNLSHGVMTEFDTPTANDIPNGIVSGENGLIWFTELMGHKIGRFDPSTQTLDEFSVPNDGQPFEIERGPSDTFWFTIQKNDLIGRITSTGQITEFSIPTRHSRPYSLALAADGAFWFEEGRANKIGRITAQGHVTNEFPLPAPSSGAHAMTASPRLGIWFTEIFVNKIASIATK
jgi:virginiamycin B lyase